MKTGIRTVLDFDPTHTKQITQITDCRYYDYLSELLMHNNFWYSNTSHEILRQLEMQNSFCVEIEQGIFIVRRSIFSNLSMIPPVAYK